MKYQTLKSFQKHLENAAPDHLCRIYLVAIHDDFERAKAIDAILFHIKASPQRFSGSDCELTDLFDAAQNFSLFGPSVIVLDEVEKLSKKQAQTVSEQWPLFSGYLLLAARGKTPLTSFVETEGVVLDLLEEKPWDQEKRLTEQLIEKAKKGGKRLSPEAVALLLERLGMDAALLESEVEKLLCYVAERPQITPEDILQISPASKESTLWQTAEEVVWEGKSFGSVDATAFHGLIPSLRSQLHLGLTLATLIEEGRPSEEWGRYLPKVWPKVLQKRSSQAARYGTAHFRKALGKLFEIELLSRTGSTQYRALLDAFRAILSI